MPTILWWWSGRIQPLSALLRPAESLGSEGPAGLWGLGKNQTNLLTPARGRAEDMSNHRHKQIPLTGSDTVTWCVRVPADAVHADPSPVGHFHPGGRPAPHRHVVHHPEDTQEWETNRNHTNTNTLFSQVLSSIPFDNVLKSSVSDDFQLLLFLKVLQSLKVEEQPNIIHSRSLFYDFLKGSFNKLKL